jgi:hypothetical protein
MVRPKPLPFARFPLRHMTMKFLLPLFALAGSALAHDASVEMAKAANAFLGALTPEQKAKAVFTFKTEPKDERIDWHFIPRPRKGLPLKEMTEPQRALATTLLKTGVSEDGFKKIETLRSLELVLAEMEKGKGPVRDPDLFFISIFGTPGGKEPWGWRWEGHHQSLNYTCADDGAPSMTPSFLGSNPGEVKEGPRKGVRVLAQEEDLGRALVKALNDEQRKTAVIMEKAPSEVLNVPGRNSTKAEGIGWAALNAEQQKQLTTIIKQYLMRCRPDVAAEDWAKVEKGGMEKLCFAWAGGFDLGQPHYYRVQAGDFVLEYDNTQNNANHPHSVWRDFGHDFGIDLLAEHYKQAHEKDAPK